MDEKEAGAARLHVAGDLTIGAEVALDEGQAHYLRNVLRLTPGARVALFNGRDGEAAAELQTLGKKSGSARVLSQTRPQTPEPDLWLLFAPLKRARVDFIAEKATELGVSRLAPVITRRTQGGRVPTDRLAAIAVEAAEQCERLSIPEVAEPVSLVDLPADWPAERRLIICDETGGGGPIASVLADLAPGPLAVLIGPEGGFAPGELETLTDIPLVTRVSLGPRILRADTAAVAVLSVVQSLLGDWRSLLPRSSQPS
ncbi:16S rRNA (uracil(1498)-N(3))-methyltransferase [Lacibacterium aquatile]|uniref:Ribosomal RNA small subunit methyltransferase E n=1 Tax=Lacibacterium aquatile TaxID=1168082 RepID=A0ABW5DW00_9PROT